MLYLFDIALLLVLIRVVIQTEKPLAPAIILAGSRLLFVRASAFSGVPETMGLITGLGMFFAVAYLYFWLLVRVPVRSFWWWVTMVSLPLIRTLQAMPLRLL